MTEGEKADFRNKLAREDEKRRAFEANSKRQLKELEENRKRLQEREQELKRQQDELDRKQAKLEKQPDESELRIQRALVTGQENPNAYTKEQPQGRS